MQDFLVTRDDNPVVAIRPRHPAQHHLPVYQPDNIGLAVEIWIVRGRPGDRDEFLTLANRTNDFARSLADIAFHLAGATANRALAF